MRVTQNMMADSTLRNLNADLARLQELQGQLTSGKRFDQASDNPVLVARAVSLQTTLDQTGQFIRNMDAAKSWLNTTDSSLGSVGEVIHRARELAVQGANDTMSAQDRAAAASEVQQLIDQTLQIANSTYQGQYVFSGHRSLTPAYALAAGVPTYQGDAGRVVREISPQTTMDVNITGSTAFDPIFSALIGLRDALQANNVAGIQAGIGQLDTAQSAVLTARAQVGAKVNRLDAQMDRLTELTVNLTELLSKAEDVDMTEAISDFSVADTVYKAALAAGARTLKPSLLDYLG